MRGDEESAVARVLALYQQSLPQDEQDVLTLATAFRDPPPEALLRDYLALGAVRHLLHDTWDRGYEPFADRREWLASTLDELIRLRLLERVGGGVIDAHPLVRRGFEHAPGRRAAASARAGFLRGRPDRRRPDTLEEARPAVELFHAHCDAGLWAEADSALVALENPKHRLLAPALERELILRFFPAGDWRQPPLWPGFARWRSLAICCEMLGQYQEAIDIYRPDDAALRGDALLALGRLEPLLETSRVAGQWQELWLAYRAHALALAGRTEEAVPLARSLVPSDVYEWVHVFECLLRAGRLDLLDLKSVLYRSPNEHRWAELARRRMRADYRRVVEDAGDLDEEYRQLSEEYARAGLVYERALAGLSHAAFLARHGRPEASEAAEATEALIGRAGLGGLVLRSRP